MVYFKIPTHSGEFNPVGALYFRNDNIWRFQYPQYRHEFGCERRPGKLFCLGY